MGLTEAIVSITGGILVLLGTVVTVRGKAGRRSVTDPDVKATETAPEARVLAMLLDQQQRIEGLEAWRAENEPRLNALAAVLADVARKLRRRIAWRRDGEGRPVPHTDEEILAQVEAIIPSDQEVSS